MEDPRQRERQYRHFIAMAVITMCREAAGRYWEKKLRVIGVDEVSP